MQIAIISLFPDLISNYLDSSILGRAQAKNIFSYKCINLREYGIGKRLKVDDRLCGGTAGMLLQAEPIWQAYLAAVDWLLNANVIATEIATNLETKTETEIEKDSSIETAKKLVLYLQQDASNLILDEQLSFDGNKLNNANSAINNLNDVANKQTTSNWLNHAKQLSEILKELGVACFYLSPKGAVFEQKTARKWAEKYRKLIFLCGHYEGVDARIFEVMPWQEISLGNFVLTGGELAVLAMVDATLRMVPGVLRNQAAFEAESLYAGLLEAPQYTQPANWRGLAVPAILLSGHHLLQAEWRETQAYLETYLKRPDLFNKLPFDNKKIGSLQAKLADLKSLTKLKEEDCEE